MYRKLPTRTVLLVFISKGNVRDKQNDDCWLHHALAPSKNRRSRPALVGADDDAAATATATDVIIVIVIELIIIV